MTGRQRTFLMLGSLAMGIPATTCIAQTWHYNTLNTYSGVITPSWVTLDRSSDGKATLTIVSGRLNACARSPLPATLTETDTSLIITTVATVPSCEDFRLVIRKDGSGGTREVKQGNEWTPDGVQRGLTLRK